MLIQGDCLKELKKLSTGSADVLVTDPPYGYSFMGKDWDKAVPRVEVWKECLRVLKPGAFAFVMSAPRSDVQCAMIARLQEAGFRCDFTPAYWTYASGFPKARKIRKATDKRFARPNALDGCYAGYQPKPAVEVVIVGMKPLSEKTFLAQALRNGKGVTRLDYCRIPIPLGESVPRLNKPYKRKGGRNFGDGKDGRLGAITGHGSSGRFPANLIVSDGVLGHYGRYFDLDAWWTKAYPFLIVPKASRTEKGRENKHPTVKPLKLMAYLLALGSHEGDTVLDPFAGSGSTCVAAQLLNRRFIGIERESEYVEIAKGRLARSRGQFQFEPGL